MTNQQRTASLNRVISLPMLIFYGVGVTIGAGIFALSGEVIAIGGDAAPWSFIVAGLIAALTAVSYAVLSSDQPRAAGEAWYVSAAFGPLAGVSVGMLLVLTAVFSSAAIAVSFANYMNELFSVSKSFLIVLVIVSISVVAWKGIRETVIFAALITCIEVGALLIVIVVGFPAVMAHDGLATALSPSVGIENLPLVLSGAVVAFFAFIGFEDIVNMGEETINAERNLPIAIIATLVITLLIYVLVSIVCISVSDRATFLQSDAPLAFVYEISTGRNSWGISLCAAIAMINGVLVQVVMSSRVLYGLSKSGSLPSWLGTLSQKTRTPVVAIVGVSTLILVFALSLSLVNLAVFSSSILLVIFCTVNLSLWKSGRRKDSPQYRRWSWWGLFAFLACFLLLCWQLWAGLMTAHP